MASGNTCSNVALVSGEGIEVPAYFPYYGHQNLIHHNTVNGSGGNHSIVAGNDVAPIVAPSASTSANDNLSH